MFNTPFSLLFLYFRKVFKRKDLTKLKIYVTLFPCNECTKAIIQAGITEVIYYSDKYADTDSTIAAKRMLDMVGITYRQYQKEGKELVLDL